MRATARFRHHDEVHFIDAGDGVAITLIRVRTDAGPTKGPVLLLHGVAMRAESFRPPVARTLVDALLDDGWDVWMLNWRGSTDLDPRPWTLDDVALHDVPSAVRYVLAQTGASSLRAVAHCQGSTALSMAAVSGLVPEVDVIVSNGVSLHPVMPTFARVKLHTLRPLVQRTQSYVDVPWRDGPEGALPRVTRNAVRMWHAECGNASCNMASFALGSGHPALWRHANLDAATHDWVATEFGRVPMSFYAQLAASDRAGQVVPIRAKGGLPVRFTATAPRTQARFALFTGAENRAFLPESQRKTHAYLERHQPGRHSLTVLRGYGHADVFLGARAHIDVYPRVLAELNA
ncbi:alpha/beta fold hydrolase [Microbacterium sp. NPDC056057]|uniref:alpha/beta fold hydrolase n=1 Tax=Microbacterium sp. NPDC056057 TaxID=3345699 RepID=UPI0035DB5681